MIRHVSCLTFTETSTPEERDAAVRAVARLPAIIPEIRVYTVGADLGLAEGNAHLAVVADFDTVDDYRVYASHPEHLAVIAEHIRPILAGRAAVQLEVPDA
ncbi:MAG: Dabb family protein [Acidimicrobiia bacterium]